jgi:hypothetical protein
MTPAAPAGPASVQDVRLQLQRLFWLALSLRVATALVAHFFAGEQMFAPDQLTYNAVGRFLADRWSLDLPIAPGALPQGPKGYFYIVAAQYYLFGAYSLIPKLLNCLVGAFGVLLVYDVALRMGAGVPAALRAATFTVWFPSLVLWSALNIRDVWIIVLILLICRQALILHTKPGPISLLVLAGSILALVQFRAYLLFAVAGPAVVSFLAQRSRKLGRNLVLGSIAAIALIYADQVAGTNRKGGRFLDFEEINTIRYWNTVGAESQLGEADISTPEKALVFLPKGLAFFLLAPFPWMLGSIRQILALPETLVYYWLLPHMFRGVRYLVRHHIRTSLMALLITAGLTLGYALGEGNVGTAYRHRAQLLSFFLIFGAVGLEARKRQPAAAPSRVLARTA